MIRFAFLSDTFFEDYPASRCPEIEQKRNRPYVVVFISVGERTFAIPMRSRPTKSTGAAWITPKPS